MSQSVAELIARRDALDRAIQRARDTGRAQAIVEARRLIEQHGLTEADLASPSHAAPPRRKVPAKFRDPVSGATWSGRGIRPRWVSAALEAGRPLSDLAV
ncbi:MAG TPA: H-NS histone family protein [Burkholderiaceae bacterium]